MLNNRDELFVEIDMLKGNINRMCTDDNLKDIASMYTFALRRLYNIFEYNSNRVEESDNIND